MSIIKDTTELSELRNGARYTWGTIQKIHDVGPRYTIVESIRQPENAIYFSCYLDGKCLSISDRNFNVALLICIAHANIELNLARYMAEAAMKCLSKPNI